MDSNELNWIKTDFDRYLKGKNGVFLSIAKAFHNPGMIFSVLYRTERYLLFHKNKTVTYIGLFFYPLYFFLTYYCLSYHIEPKVQIGPGLFLHNRDIVITDQTIIGKNATIMGQTIIGTGFNNGSVSIVIGDNVRIGSGAKIIANRSLTITDDVTIGSNAVVTKSILSKHVTVVGIPAKII